MALRNDRWRAPIARARAALINFAFVAAARRETIVGREAQEWK